MVYFTLDMQRMLMIKLRNFYLNLSVLIMLCGVLGQSSSTFAATIGKNKSQQIDECLTSPATKSKALDEYCKLKLKKGDQAALYGDQQAINEVGRKLARLKYTIDKLGLEVFKNKLFAYQGFDLAVPKAFEFKNNADRYGWFLDENNRWHLTLYIHSGRIIDSEQSKLFSGLLEIAKIHDGEFRISPNQNMIISNIEYDNRERIERLLSKYKISIGKYETPARLNSLACVAFPTCSLAMAEAERYLPEFITKVEGLMNRYELSKQPINIRMTGCPNGCARPFLGEIGLVGKGPGKYNLYLGASHTGDRLNRLYRENINEEAILAELKPLFKLYSQERNNDEPFGDFLIRKNIVRKVNNGLDFH